MKLLAIPGSVRKASTNRVMLEAFRANAPDGIEIEVFSGLADLPIFDPDREGPMTPDPVLRFADSIARADGLIIAAPEYAHGVPGGLKNALDWLVSRSEVPGKPVMLVHASKRGAHLREHLCEVLRTMSLRMFEGTTYELHLLGKSDTEVRESLSAEESITAMRGAINAFAAFAESARENSSG